jgi:hypothetical protein
MKLIAVKENRDFYLTDKGQIVEFEFSFIGANYNPKFQADKRKHPIAIKDVEAVSRGTYLRHGRRFDSRELAENYLVKYLRQS